jgi:hypothetical protein
MRMIVLNKYKRYLKFLIPIVILFLLFAFYYFFYIPDDARRISSEEAIKIAVEEFKIIETRCGSSSPESYIPPEEIEVKLTKRRGEVVYLVTFKQFHPDHKEIYYHYFYYVQQYGRYVIAKDTIYHRPFWVGIPLK